MALLALGFRPGANLLWHAHELLFGYAFAVIAGFLLTAVRAWTQRATPTGAALWLLARLAAFHAPMAASVLDATFTNNAVAGAGARRSAWLERGALGAPGS